MAVDNFTRTVEELTNMLKYPFGSCSHLKIEGSLECTYEEAARWLAVNGASPSLKACGIWSLARCINGEMKSITIPDGRVLAEREIYFEALRIDPLFAYPYCSLGVDLAVNELIEIDHQTYDEKWLYIKAIQLNPKEGIFFFNLGNVMSAKEEIDLLDGSRQSKKNLIITSLNLNARIFRAYISLSQVMGGWEEVSFDGSLWDRKRLMVRGLQHYPQEKLIKYLHSWMARGTRVQWHDGRYLSRQQLQAICEK
jgi:hypothetical protein